jgi:hypothetical protein
MIPIDGIAVGLLYIICKPRILCVYISSLAEDELLHATGMLDPLSARI